MRTFLLFHLCVSTLLFAEDKAFPLTLQSRSPSGVVQQVKEEWLPSRSAIIVCDMWDAHPCRYAFLREGEMAPRMDALLRKARDMGLFIIHAPSSCMAAYEGTAARERARAAPLAARLPDKISQWCRQIPAEELAVYPLDQSDGGVDEEPAVHEAWLKELTAQGRNVKAPWLAQTAALHIDQEKDAISDSGVEVWNLLEARGIQNVILMGVHTNMCVAGRPFGLRQMAKNGKHVVLMRDLTDTMYNPLRWPFVSHVRGTELFVAHVEKRICPSISSEQILGGQPFRYSSATAGPRRLHILLLGDSTTEASLPRKVAPEEPQFEDTLRILLAQRQGLPAVNVTNEGLSGEYVRRLLDSGRYEKEIAKGPAADVIFIRYGLNDAKHRKAEFSADYKELLGRLRKDQPQARLVMMTCIPYALDNLHEDMNATIRQLAEEEKLPLFDIAPRYLAELKKGPDMLCYRRYPLAKVPEELRPLTTPYLLAGTDPQVVVMDNRLDALLGHLPGWFADRHPNLAGYHVIADETAKWIEPLLREWK